MSRGIFLIGEDKNLVKLEEQPYDTEDLLQNLLATHPDLLAGDQIDRASPRRWLLISREMDLASEEDGSARWPVDHLFVDQDAIPTVIEVKRGSDTRIRREVVGQMLEYAANAVMYWPVETLRARYELLSQLNQIEGVTIPPTAISKRPNIPLSVFKNEMALGKFLGTIEWVIKEIKTGGTPQMVPP